MLGAVMSAAPLARASLVAALAWVAGCGGAGSARLQGKWKGQKAEGVVPAALASANTFAAGMLLEVKGDAITVTTARDRQAGRYKVIKEDPKTVVIATDKDGLGDPQTFTFPDDKTLKWAVADGQTIVFAKQ
jgi:hypothetical protein